MQMRVAALAAGEEGFQERAGAVGMMMVVVIMAAEAVLAMMMIIVVMMF